MFIVVNPSLLVKKLDHVTKLFDFIRPIHWLVCIPVKWYYHVALEAHLTPVKVSMNCLVCEAI